MSFDPIKIEMALEFVKLEIEKSIRKENGESN